MGLKDLYPSKEDWKELKNFTDPQYLKEKSLWWHLEQLLSLAFVILAIVHASAFADYKMTIQSELEEKGCFEAMTNGVEADLYNQSELPDSFNKTNYEELRPEIDKETGSDPPEYSLSE